MVSKCPPAPVQGMADRPGSGTMQAMDTPKQPASPQPHPDLQARVAKWLEFKREMEALHAQLEYARLMLKLGVVKR